MEQLMYPFYALGQYVMFLDYVYNACYLNCVYYVCI